MSETSSPFGAVISTQRRFIDGAIETQRSLSRGGLRLTRRSATAVVGIVPDDEGRATERLGGFFDDVESAQDDLFDGLQDAVGDGLDRVEETAEGAVDIVEDAETELGDATGTVGSGVEAADEAAEDVREAPGDAVESPSVEALSGIGPTYAERLSEAGFGTVADLAAASADAVADAAQVGESRAREWIEAARELNRA